jgi:hypothetical protein
MENDRAARRHRLWRRGRTAVLIAAWLAGLYLLLVMECPLARSSTWRYGLIGAFKGAEQPPLWWFHALRGDVQGLRIDWGAFAVSVALIAVWTWYLSDIWRRSGADLSRSLVASRRRSRRCPGCGYDLRGADRAHSKRCPECGSRIDKGGRGTDGKSETS